MNTNIYIPVIDFEASGFGPESYPIEVGLILNNGMTYQSLISPHEHWTQWEEKASNMHGITREQLLKFGKSPQLVCQELNQYCQDQVLYTDCWAHDQNWLNALYDSVGVSCSFRLNPIEYWLTEAQMDKWPQYKSTIANYNDIEQHRALNDAIIISNTMASIRAQKQRRAISVNA
jgi:DNA polymerase III alpha subunit (gram-positive type)